MVLTVSSHLKNQKCLSVRVSTTNRAFGISGGLSETAVVTFISEEGSVQHGCCFLLFLHWSCPWTMQLRWSSCGLPDRWVAHLGISRDGFPPSVFPKPGEPPPLGFCCVFSDVSLASRWVLAPSHLPRLSYRSPCFLPSESPHPLPIRS